MLQWLVVAKTLPLNYSIPMAAAESTFFDIFITRHFSGLIAASLCRYTNTLMRFSPLKSSGSRHTSTCEMLLLISHPATATEPVELEIPQHALLTQGQTALLLIHQVEAALSVQQKPRTSASSQFSLSSRKARPWAWKETCHTPAWTIMLKTAACCRAQTLCVIIDRCVLCCCRY